MKIIFKNYDRSWHVTDSLVYTPPKGKTVVVTPAHIYLVTADVVDNPAESDIITVARVSVHGGGWTVARPCLPSPDHINAFHIATVVE